MIANDHVQPGNRICYNGRVIHIHARKGDRVLLSQWKLWEGGESICIPAPWVTGNKDFQIILGSDIEDSHFDEPDDPIEAVYRQIVEEEEARNNPPYNFNADYYWEESTLATEDEWKAFLSDVRYAMTGYTC